MVTDMIFFHSQETVPLKRKMLSFLVKKRISRWSFISLPQGLLRIENLLTEIISLDPNFQSKYNGS